MEVVEENAEYKSPKMEEVYPSEWKVDELYLIALQDHDELFQISDEAYAEELQLQEILLPSSSSLVAEVVSSRSVISPPPVVSVLMEAVPSSSSSEAKVVEEDAESSAKFCSICMDKKPCDEFFNGPSCAHSFCVDCTSTYVATKIQENISMVKCPDNKCKGIISPNDCNSIVPKQVLERWEKALVESLILVSGTTLYCPFKDCSSLILNDDSVVGSAECPMCHRLFCTQCKVGWHQGVECSEFQRLSSADQIDVEAVKFAKGKSWQRCPKCQFFVEKTTGCLHIVCRCSFEFCYGCGSSWSSTHACPDPYVE